MIRCPPNRRCILIVINVPCRSRHGIESSRERKAPLPVECDGLKKSCGSLDRESEMWFGERIEGYSGESLRFSRTMKLDLNVSRITGRASDLLFL